MAKIRIGKHGYQNAIFDADRDTGVRVEKTADDDTVRVDAGGNTDIVKVTSSKVHINDDGDDVDFQVEGDTDPNAFYIDAANDGTGLGTSSSTFVRNGSTIRSKFVAIKPDAADWNAGAQGIYTSNATRAADFSLFKAGGSESSPSAVGSSDVISNVRFEGHDGTDLIVGAVIQALVDGTVAANTVDMQLRLQTALSGVLTSNLILRASGFIGTTGRINPLSGLDLGSSLGLTRRASAVSTTSQASDIIIAITNTAAARTVTLRTEDTVGRRVYFIVDESGNAAVNNITIDTAGTELISGAATQTIATNYGAIGVYSNGTNWFRLF